jgi:alcohol dehydrogenase class IV
VSATLDPNLRHVTPSFRTFCGDAAPGALAAELARVGAERAVIICVPSILKHPDALQRLHDALGEHLVGQFGGAVEHSPLPSVERARQFLADHEADAVIAVGGGSSVVTARAASVLLAERRDIRELCTYRDADGRFVSPRLNTPKLPQWVVPSTPTTAYAKAGSAVRDPSTGLRLALYDPKTRAQGIILDPVMAKTAPAGLAWSASLNAFSMAVEGLQSQRVDPLADALLFQALREVVEWLPRLGDAPEDAEPRLHLMLAALMSGQGSDHTGGGLAQALSHAVGPRSRVANGVVEAILLPHAMRFNAGVVGHRLASLADVLRIPERSPEGVIAGVERLLGVLDVPTQLRAVGLSEDDVAESAELVMNDWAIGGLPRTPRLDEVQQILSNAW